MDTQHAKSIIKECIWQSVKCHNLRNQRLNGAAFNLGDDWGSITTNITTEWWLYKLLFQIEQNTRILIRTIYPDAYVEYSFKNGIFKMLIYYSAGKTFDIIVHIDNI